jgi:hypothetical protein
MGAWLVGDKLQALYVEGMFEKNTTQQPAAA